MLNKLTFTKLVEMNKKSPVYCTVNHWLIKKDEHCFSELSNIWNDYTDGEYVEFSKLLSVLSNMCGEFISAIILDGEWYIKEGE